MYTFCTNCNHVFINSTEHEAPECPKCHEKTKYNNIIVKKLEDLAKEEEEIL